MLAGLADAPDLAALRNLLGQLFERVLYLSAGHPWITPTLGAGPEVGAGAWPLPVLKPGVIVGYEGENEDFEADYAAGALGPFDPAERAPRALVGRVPFPFPVEAVEGIQRCSSPASSSRRIGLLM